jgi:hypothetical protein
VTPAPQTGAGMSAERAPPTAVLIVRLWRDTADKRGFRARILRTHDIEHEPEEALAAGSLDELLAVVRGWVEEFLLRDPGSPTSVS